MSIKANVLYNTILTISNYIVALLVFPYVSRVLGVNNIGIVSFVDNAINYFILFSTLGIGMLGSREIAKYKNNQEKLNSIVSTLLCITFTLTFITLIAYALSIRYISKFSIYSDLFYIGTLKLIFSGLMVEWFYRGLENFKYISIRYITIRLLYIISIFVFVKSQNDYKVYFILTIGIVVINSLINLIYSRRYFRFSFKDIRMFYYLPKTLSLGIYSILISLYTTFNILFLGIMTNTIQVGYYWTSLKIYNIILGLFSAFSAVMLPRMSSLLAEGNIKNFKILIEKSLNIIITISVSITIFTVILAPQIIELLTGKGYEGAIVPMQIIMPNLVFVGLAQIIVEQVLMPLERDKSIIKIALIGGVVSIVLNYSLIESFESVGTAISFLTAEFIVLSLYLYIISKEKIIDFPWLLFFKKFVFYLPIGLIAFCFTGIFKTHFVIIGVSLFFSTIYFLSIEYFVFNNKALFSIIHGSVLKFVKKRN